MQHVISFVKDVDIEELRSDIVLQVEAELFLGNMMGVELVHLYNIRKSTFMHKNVVIVGAI